MPELKYAERDAPLVTPIWFSLEEGHTWFTPRWHSEWLQNLRDDHRVSLRIAHRHLPVEAADGDVDGTDDQPRALCVVVIEDSEVRAWRMVVGHEPAHGALAKRATGRLMRKIRHRPKFQSTRRSSAAC